MITVPMIVFPIAMLLALMAVSFKIVPNPASEFVSIILNRGEIHQITVYDVHGREIYENHPTPSTSHQIAISSWSSGIYFIKSITTTGFSTIKKLIIQ